MKNLIKTAAVSAIALGGAYILSTQGRTGHPGLEAFRGWHYAHRGLHDETRPENSMAAFRAALEAGYGIEFDLHLIKDGNLAVMHDSNLLRTTGVEGKITDLTTEDLCHYHLGGTEETIPTFSDVLRLFDGKAPLIIELKADGNNFKALVDVAVKAVEGYEGPYCMESFDPRVVFVLQRYYPHIIRGQLTEDYFSFDSPLPWALRWALKHQSLNFLTKPDFVAYNTKHRHTFSNKLVRSFWGLQGVTWTVKDKADFDDAVADGWLPIFEGFTP